MHCLLEKGKKLRVREPTCHKNQNGFPCKKSCVMEKFVTDYSGLWPILKPIEGPENIMLEVKVKLSAMPLGGRNRVLYKEIFTNFYFFHPHHVYLIPSDANDPQGLMRR